MPKSEVVTRTIIHDAFRQGKQIFVPYIYYNNKLHVHPKSRAAMNMVSLHSKSDYEALEPDAWGIPTVAEDSITQRIRILDDLGYSTGSVSQGVAVREKDSKSRNTEFGNLDLIVMPGVAFDRDLGRLGHGKGFYDQFLKRYYDSKPFLLEEVKMPFLGACQGLYYTSNPVMLMLTRSPLVGLALDVQLLLDKVPTDASDWRLDALIVGDGSFLTKPKEIPER